MKIYRLEYHHEITFLKENKWYGITIKKRIKIKEINILFGEETIVILPKNLNAFLNYLEFYVIIKRYLKINKEIKNFFGIFFDENLNIRRQKIKNSIFEKFEKEDLTSILEGNDESVYYSENIKHENFIGLEIRLGNDINNWLNEYEEIGEIQKEIEIEKKKIFN